MQPPGNSAFACLHARDHSCAAANAHSNLTSRKLLDRVSISGSFVRRVSKNRIDQGDTTMRFMMIVKANEDTEAGVMPKTELLDAMGKYNEEIVKAGVLLGGDGLHPSSKGARIEIAADGKRTVLDGPFAETKELIAG